MMPSEIVSSESPNRIRDHLSRRARYNPTRSLTALTSQLSQEYEDRFLVELIQNAYDAHPPGARDGRLHVWLDESSDGQPTLYVANTGRPFTSENFDALTNVAQSSKPPGEGIGNKGIGFRSVLQVCESPEIYSCDPETVSGSDFDGFCFGFATDLQIRSMVSDDSQYAAIKDDFSRYLLPVVVRPTAPPLRVLRALGMVTVVRLPLTTSRAVELARAQVQGLLEPTPPIALFLDRLESITVDHISGDEEHITAQVDRRVTDVVVSEGGPILRWVETVGRRFLTTTRALPATEVREVVDSAITLGELDQSWAAWDSDVEVSIALLTGDSEQDGSGPSTYTYLPMRIASPLAAHLHAPFHTKLARLDLNEKSLFNSFLLEIAAALSAATIQLLIAGKDLELDLRTRQAAVVDLLCWDPDHIEYLVAALEAVGLDLESSSLIPARGPQGVTWAGLRQVRTWSSAGLEVITDESVEGQAHLLEPSIGQDRVQRLGAVSEHFLSHDLDPGDDEVAEWIERIAKGLHGASIAKWNRFLSDVAVVFESRRAIALQGRFLLLDDKQKLRRAGPWESVESSSSEPTVFIPPQPSGAVGESGVDDEESDLSTVPKNLQRSIAFLHKGIKVRTRVGRTFKRTPVGELFKKADLVESFELTEMLSHLERLLSGNVSSATRRQALSWVYLQERASRSNIADLARLGLHVPTVGGWVPASEAVFSEGWRTARSATLASLVAHAAGLSESTRALGERAILGPGEWPFKLKDREAFHEYLARCGVRDGLFPVALRSRTAIRMNGINFTAATIAERFILADSEGWAQHVTETWQRELAGPYTPYSGDKDLWIVPGQEAFGSLGANGKDRLAAAILESIGDWPDETWMYGFRRRSPAHVHRPDPQAWPSPARTFVERAAWFPMSDAGRRDERYFVPVSEAWNFDESGTDTAPRFARLAPIDHRHRIAASRSATGRLDNAGLMTWNSVASAGPRLRELADLVVSGEVTEAELLSVRRAVAQAWSEVVRGSTEALPTDVRLLVSRGFALGVVEPSASEPPEVFVHDGTPGLVGQVLEASSYPILVADPDDGERIAEALAGNEGFVVRRSSTVEANVILDDQEMSPSAEAGDALLEIFEPWLVRTLLAIIDIRSTRFARVTDKVLHDAEARLRRIRLVIGSTIDLTVDGRGLSAAGRLAECIHIDDPTHPLLVLNGTDVDVPSWRSLEMLADDLAELIGQGQGASEIRAAALAFQRLIGDWREPSDEEIATVLRCSVEAVTEVLHNLRTSSDQLRFLLAPFIGVLAGVEAARRIQTEAVADLNELQTLVTELIGEDQGLALFGRATRAESIAGIRREMGTDLGELNTMLSELAYPPLHFAEMHQTALTSYLNECRVRTLGELRQRFLALFVAGVDLAEYTTARDFRDVQPDPTWLHDHEVLSDAMMQTLVELWLTTKGQPPRLAQPLESVDEVRAANRSLLDDCLPRMARLIAAWSTKSGVERADVWSETGRVRDALGASGCLDFVELGDEQLLTWLVRLKLWPSGMAATLDASELGLSAADLEKSDSLPSDDRRKRKRTELTFGDRTFDTTTEELRDLIEAVAASADEGFLRTRSTPTKLSAISLPRGRKGRASAGSRGAPKSYGGPQPTQEQTAAIGLAGEALAYRWLQNAYTQTTPDSWVSANRTFELGGHAGRDDLGYDFLIARKNETLYFEVKSTTTDEYEFDIGESELAAARAARKGCYRIIHIRSVLQPELRQLLVVPNPLDPAYVTSFAQINKGMRLRFDPT